MSLIITSPLRGWASALDSVPDPVFAQRMMGDGVAIQPLGDTVVAPFDGEVVTLHDAGHAVSLRSDTARSEEHTSELQSLMCISYAVFCLKKKTTIIMTE